MGKRGGWQGTRKSRGRGNCGWDILHETKFLKGCVEFILFLSSVMIKITIT